MSRQIDIRFPKRNPNGRVAWSVLASVGFLAVTGCSDDPIGGNMQPGTPVPGATAGSGTTGGASGTVGGPGGTVPGVAGPGTAGPGTAGPDSTVPGVGTAPAPNGTTPELVESEPEVDPKIFTTTPKSMLRLLTQVEYMHSVSALLQIEVTDVELPDDNPVAGFGTVGATELIVGERSLEQYETASQVLTTGLFNDEARWQQLVGCAPQPDLSDACVETYVRSFGRRAFRRDMTEEEAQQWLGLARTVAGQTEATEVAAATGLAAATAGMLQSPNFLYRYEYAVPDTTLGRVKFDGPSMATRLSYLFTGAPPTDALLDAAAAGELDTPEGIRAAAAELFAQPRAAEFMSDYFTELTHLYLIHEAEKDMENFSYVDDSLRASMLEEVRLWLSDLVLAEGADVRSFFDSTTTYVDDALADFYEIQAPPGEGFRQVELPPETDRAGILGKAAFLLVHSSPDSSNPTRRGNFILKNFNCMSVPPPPADLVVTVPEQDENGAPKTTRELFEQHSIDATCVACHSVMDPFGFALEHFDAVGAYRETENGLPIDATGEFQGAAFDGAAGLATVLRENEATAACFVKNFYRYANGTPDDTTDGELIVSLGELLAEKNYVWRDMLVEFAASDAFTSLAPSGE